MKTVLYLIVLIAVIPSWSPLRAQTAEITFYISPEGNDSYSGTRIDQAFATLAKAEPHTGFILKNNILLSDGTPIYAGGYEYFVEMTGAFEADSNLVWSTAGEVIAAQNRFSSRLYEPDKPVMSWEEWLTLGRDQHTIIADPGFKDPENGDFTLPENSPAFQIGFKPFPLDQAGPR